MTIVLREEASIFALPLSERKTVIEPSYSEFSNPIFIHFQDPSWSLRLCLHCRRVNKVMLKDRYPLLLIKDQLDILQNARIFSSIDLRNRFIHVNVTESSRKHTSFVTIMASTNLKRCRLDCQIHQRYSKGSLTNVNK